MKSNMKSSMMNYKDYIANILLGKKVRIVCDCIIKLDVCGTISYYEVRDGEIIYYINTGDRVVKIGENTPKLQIEDIIS